MSQSAHCCTSLRPFARRHPQADCALAAASPPHCIDCSHCHCGCTGWMPARTTLQMSGLRCAAAHSERRASGWRGSCTGVRPCSCHRATCSPTSVAARCGFLGEDYRTVSPNAHAAVAATAYVRACAVMYGMLPSKRLQPSQAWAGTARAGLAQPRCTVPSDRSCTHKAALMFRLCLQGLALKAAVQGAAVLLGGHVGWAGVPCQQQRRRAKAGVLRSLAWCPAPMRRMRQRGPQQSHVPHARPKAHGRAAQGHAWAGCAAP